MNIKHKKTIKITLFILGFLLVISAILSLALFPFIQNKKATNARNIATEIKSLLPQNISGTFNDRTNVTMPSFEFNGENYVCIVEIPRFEISLPVYSKFENSKLFSSPCRYSGSIYDKTLVIGGSGNEGQFNFAESITEGDHVFLTDMNGAKYSFVVSEIILTKELSQQTFYQKESDLVLFTKKSFSSEYCVIYCKTKL